MIDIARCIVFLLFHSDVCNHTNENKHTQKLYSIKIKLCLWKIEKINTQKQSTIYNWLRIHYSQMNRYVFTYAAEKQKLLARLYLFLFCDIKKKSKTENFFEFYESNGAAKTDSMTTMAMMHPFTSRNFVILWGKSCKRSVLTGI